MADEVSRPPGIIAEGIAGIALKFGSAASDLGALSAVSRKERLYRELYQTPVVLPQIPVTAGAGVLQPTDSSGPMTGQYWSIRRLVASGYSAGSVAVYRNAVITGTGAAAAAAGEILFTFPQAGAYTFGRGEMLLSPDDFLVFVATGITLITGQSGVSILGAADCLAAWLLPEYIG
jgi:hypothetical protein